MQKESFDRSLFIIIFSDFNNWPKFWLLSEILFLIYSDFDFIILKSESELSKIGSLSILLSSSIICLLISLLFFIIFWGFTTTVFDSFLLLLSSKKLS